MKNITIRYPYDKDINITREDDYGLEDAFAEFNAGSCHECPEFIGAKIRSFSVGDLVGMDGKWFRCESCGWKEMTEQEMMEYMTAIETRLIGLRQVENDPNLPAWFAVNDVVYNHALRKGGRFYSQPSTEPLPEADPNWEQKLNPVWRTMNDR